MMKKFLNWLKSPESDFILFLLLLVLANVAGHSLFARIDLTAPKSYSLSKASKTLVRNLEQPLSVRVFFDDNLPAPYSSTAQYVKDVLVEYKGAANRNFSVAYMDMSKPENVQLARNLGLSQVQIQEVKNNEVGFKQAFMGIAISYSDAIETLDPVTTSDGFEYKFTSKVSKMISTADVLAGLSRDEKIRLTLYFSDVIKTFRISGADELEDVVRETFAAVNRQNQNRLELSVVSPGSDEAKNIIEKYGIQTIAYKDDDGNPGTAVLGLVLEYEDSFRVLPVQIQQSIFGYLISGLDQLETDISESLQSLFAKTTQIGYVTGHDELSHTDENYALYFSNLISGLYELTDLNLAEENIPAGMNSIIINGPKSDFSDEELFKIDQFVMRGGNVLFFVDSMNLNEMAAYYGGDQFTPNQTNLDILLQKYGVTRNLNMVMDENCYTAANSQYGKLSYYWAPILEKGQLAKKHPITSNLGQVIMLQNGSLDVSAAEADKDLAVTVLAVSSEKSWEMEQGVMLNPMVLSPPADKAQLGQKNLAVLVEGKFTSAFDSAPESEEQAQDGLLETTNHIKSGILPGKIFVVGSSAVTTYQVIDANGSSPVAMFLLNAVDYLNGNEELCSMRTKGLLVNTLKNQTGKAAAFWKLFNQFGLAVLVAVAGLLVWRARVKRRKAINARYNPNDERTISKGGAK